MPEPNTEPEEATELAMTDRRIWVRYGAELEAICRSNSPRKEIGWAAKVKDISQGGVGLILRHRFRSGTPLLVELRDRAGTMRRLVPVRVVHAHAIQGGGEPSWLMGCAFETKLSEAELKALL